MFREVAIVTIVDHQFHSVCNNLIAGCSGLIVLPQFVYKPQLILYVCLQHKWHAVWLC